MLSPGRCIVSLRDSTATASGCVRDIPWLCGSAKRVLMGKGRLEAFSDGVLAIIITIMVLELKVPHGESLDALAQFVPVFLSYVLSFVYVGIYWNNHHHMLHASHKESGRVPQAPLH